MAKVIGIILVIATIVTGIASRFIFKKTDNPVEEIAEEIIENETGYSIDLSPDTPDKESESEEVSKIQKDYDGQDK